MSKFPFYLSFTFHYFYPQISSFTQLFIHKNFFELFAPPHFLFWEILTWIWRLPFAEYLKLNLSRCYPNKKMRMIINFLVIIDEISCALWKTERISNIAFSTERSGVEMRIVITVIVIIVVVVVVVVFSKIERRRVWRLGKSSLTLYKVYYAPIHPPAALSIWFKKCLIRQQGIQKSSSQRYIARKI